MKFYAYSYKKVIVHPYNHPHQHQRTEDRVPGWENITMQTHNVSLQEKEGPTPGATKIVGKKSYHGLGEAKPFPPLGLMG